MADDEDVVNATEEEVCLLEVDVRKDRYGVFLV